MRYRVSCHPLNEDTLELKVEVADSISNIMKEVNSQIINLKDKAIRKALTDMGWTPPKEK